MGFAAIGFVGIWPGQCDRAAVFHAVDRRASRPILARAAWLLSCQVDEHPKFLTDESLAAFLKRMFSIRRSVELLKAPAPKFLVVLIYRPGGLNLLFRIRC